MPGIRVRVLAVPSIRVRVLALSVLLLAPHVPMTALLAVSVLAPASCRSAPGVQGIAAGLGGLRPPSALAVLLLSARVLLFDPPFLFTLLLDDSLLLSALLFPALPGSLSLLAVLASLLVRLSP